MDKVSTIVIVCMKLHNFNIESSMNISNEDPSPHEHNTIQRTPEVHLQDSLHFERDYTHRRTNHSPHHLRENLVQILEGTGLRRS